MSALFSGMVFPKPLSDEEETLCIERYEKGDTEARKILIEHNMRLVAHIAKKYSMSIASAEYDDVISMGTVGLIKAVDSFKSERKIKLGTYAARCIENEILMYMRSSKKFGGDVFLQDTVGRDFDGNEITIMDIVKTDSDSVADDVELKINIEKMFETIEKVLDEREQKIICMRYAINGEEERTQQEIADMFKISRSYVSRIEKKALNKIRAEMRI